MTCRYDDKEEIERISQDLTSWSKKIMMAIMKEKNFNGITSTDQKKAFEGCLKIYPPDPQAKDMMTASIKRKFQKLVTMEVQTHFNQIHLLFDHINQPL